MGRKRRKKKTMTWQQKKQQEQQRLRRERQERAVAERKKQQQAAQAGPPPQQPQQPAQQVPVQPQVQPQPHIQAQPQQQPRGPGPQQYQPQARQPQQYVQPQPRYQPQHQPQQYVQRQAQPRRQQYQQRKPPYQAQPQHVQAQPQQVQHPAPQQKQQYAATGPAVQQQQPPTAKAAPQKSGDKKDFYDDASYSKFVRKLKSMHIFNLPFAARPAYGKRGKALILRTNYFGLKFHNTAFVQYAVAFTPALPTDSKRLRFSMLAGVTEAITKQLGIFAFDGSSIFAKRDIQQFAVYSMYREKQYTIRITKALQFDFNSHPVVTTQLLNIIFKKLLRYLKLEQIGRRYYEKSKTVKVPGHPLEVWPGFLTSVLLTAYGVQTIVDVSHRVLRTETVYEWMSNQYQSFNNQGRFRKHIEQGLLNSIVLTKYNNRTYRIEKIAWDMTPKMTFKLSTGETVSYQKYYSTRYNLKIAHVNSPLLVNFNRRTKQQVYLIPELCFMSGITDQMRRDRNMMRQLSNCTRTRPNERYFDSNSLLRRFLQNPNITAELRSWDVTMNNQMNTVRARQLDPVTVYFKKRTCRGGEFETDLRNYGIQIPVVVNDWMIFADQRDTPVVNNFEKALCQAAKKLGVVIRPNAQKYWVRNSRRENAFADLLRSVLKKKKCDIVVIVLPVKTSKLYRSVKQVCFSDYPVPSQCVLTSTLRRQRQLLSICSKILYQINCKLGGKLWYINTPTRKGTMLVGIDVYHNTREKHKSVAGFCATVNDTFSEYYSMATFQSPGKELVASLKRCFYQSLKRYQVVNKSLPNTIIFYRDGVGQSQRAEVVSYEIPQLRSTFALFANYHPKLTFMVVQKRINTRLFAQVGKRLTNPGPGTIVDQGITHPKFYDFFLIGQKVTQGTATPSHYHVLCDDGHINVDDLQELTFNLCHLYYNWPAGIRVPAPCQYAHKIAYLIGQAVQKAINPHHNTRLYFL